MDSFLGNFDMPKHKATIRGK